MSDIKLFRFSKNGAQELRLTCMLWRRLAGTLNSSVTVFF